jgi:hypothetical protein
MIEFTKVILAAMVLMCIWVAGVSVLFDSAQGTTVSIPMRPEVDIAIAQVGEIHSRIAPLPWSHSHLPTEPGWYFVRFKHSEENYTDGIWQVVEFSGDLILRMCSYSYLIDEMGEEWEFSSRIDWWPQELNNE